MRDSKICHNNKDKILNNVVSMMVMKHIIVKDSIIILREMNLNLYMEVTLIVKNQVYV
jgi:hypothetical protein